MGIDEDDPSSCVAIPAAIYIEYTAHQEEAGADDSPLCIFDTRALVVHGNCVDHNSEAAEVLFPQKVRYPKTKCI
jgi:hypothetical protein